MKPLTVDTILGPLAAERVREQEAEVAARLQAVVEGVAVEVTQAQEQLRGAMAGQAVAGATAGTAISSATTLAEFGHVRAECPVELKKLARSPHAAMMTAAAQQTQHRTLAPGFWCDTSHVA
jgi:hypothetical protein